MKKLIQNLWKIFLVTLPFSIHYVFYEAASYRFGQFNPWVTGILYLPEVLLGLIFIMWMVDRLQHSPTLKRSKKKGRGFKVLSFLFWFFFLLNAGFITFLQGDFILFFVFAFKVFMAVIVCLLLQDELIPKEHTVLYLLYGALFQVIIGGLQVYFNGSIGLEWLGESQLSAESFNVAKNDLANGSKQIRAYGTFLHPNILGAYLVTILFLSLPHLKRAGRLLWPLVLLFGIYLTGSQAALLTTGILLGAWILFKIVRQPVHQKISLVLGFFVLMMVNSWFFFNHGQMGVEDPSISQRVMQNEIAQDMLKDNLSGVGVQNFTLNMENHSEERLMPWEVQPVHNVYFLVLNEMGLQGLVLLLILISLTLKSFFKRIDLKRENVATIFPFLGLLILASFDHLLMTSYVGLLLVALALCHSRLK